MPSKPSRKGEPAPSLADYTDAPLVVLQVRERDTAGIIQELSRVLAQGGRVPDLLPFYNAALNREFLVSTATDYGLAFPHARLAGLREVWFALGRSAEPLAWGPRTAQPVRVVFLIAVPASDTTTYLPLIAALGKLGKDRALMKQLLDAPGTEEVLAVLRLVKLRTLREAVTVD